VLIALLIASVGFALASRRIPDLVQRALGLATVMLTVGLILQDQNRLQPWVYQFVMMTLALAMTSEARALALARVFLVALYVHSGLSKLDVSFCDELGRTFLETAVHPFGLTPERWPRVWSRTAVLAMPLGELAAGIGLVFARTRRIALVGVVSLHIALIAILSPAGMGHSAIVLVWNAAVLVEDVILFGAPGTVWPGISGTTVDRAVAALVLIAVLLPLGERSGVWDTWPSFALYASHAERTDVFIDHDELETFPAEVKRHGSSRAEEGWVRIDLTAWSRSERGVPLYPQGRTANGVAEAFAGWRGRPRLVRVIQWGRAEPWTGRRTRVELFGLDAIRRWGDRYWLNAHPAPETWGHEAPPTIIR
jgi:hypothetical protein